MVTVESSKFAVQTAPRPTTISAGSFPTGIGGPKSAAVLRSILVTVESPPFATQTDPHAARIAELAAHDLAALTALLHRAVSVEARVRAAGLTDPAPEIAALEQDSVI